MHIGGKLASKWIRKLNTPWDTEKLTMFHGQQCTGSLPNVVSQQYINNYKATIKDKATRIKAMFGTKFKSRRDSSNSSDVESLLDQDHPKLVKQLRDSVHDGHQPRFEHIKYRSGPPSDTASIISNHQPRFEHMKYRSGPPSDAGSMLSNHSSPSRCWVTPFKNDVPNHTNPRRPNVQRTYSPSITSKSSTSWDIEHDQASSVPESVIADADRKHPSKADQRKQKKRKSKKLGNVMGTKKMLELLETQPAVKVENIIGYRHSKTS